MPAAVDLWNQLPGIRLVTHKDSLGYPSSGGSLFPEIALKGDYAFSRDSLAVIQAKRCWQAAPSGEPAVRWVQSGRAARFG